MEMEFNEPDMSPLVPEPGEYHTRHTIRNPNKSLENNADSLMGVIAILSEIFSKDQVVVNLNLDVTYIDGPEPPIKTVIIPIGDGTNRIGGALDE